MKSYRAITPHGYVWDPATHKFIRSPRTKEQGMKSEVRVAANPSPVHYPFLWRGASGTIWLRNKLGGNQSADVAVASPDGTHIIGEQRLNITTEACAYSQRLPVGSVVVLTQTD